MNSKNNFFHIIASFIISTFFLASLAAVPVFAQTAAATTAVGVTASVTSTALSSIITKSDTAIVARITALDNLNTRVQALKNVSADEKTTIATDVQTNISGLTVLKAKIDADIDVTTAKADAKTITGSYRIYALIIPQGYILAATDRVNTIVGMMATIGTKLQTRITSSQSAGKDVTALQASLTDFNAKIADAQTQATAAQNGIATLTPDQGNKTQLQANTTALKAARADIKTSTQDLQAARTDAKNIVQGLKTMDGATSSTSASVTTQ